MTPGAAQILALGLDDPLFGCAPEQAGGYNLQQDPSELAELLSFLAPRLKVRQPYLEIGVAAGGLARLMKEVLDVGPLYLIDDGRHPKAGLLPGILSGLPYVLHVGDSHQPAAGDWLRRMFPLMFTKPGLIVIDGDHSYAGVIQDTLLVLPHLAPGGCLVFHDALTYPNDVGRWVDELRRGWTLPYQLELVLAVERRFGLHVFQLREDEGGVNESRFLAHSETKEKTA